MQENEGKVLALIFGHEGKFSNRAAKDDPGRATMYGITAKTLGNYRHLNREATVEEVQTLRPDEARQIIRSQYLLPIQFGMLPAGVDYAAADFAVNSGPAQAVRTAQKVVGAVQDGTMGANTRKAIEAYGVGRFLEDYAAARLSFMGRLSNWGANKNGWRSRVDRVKTTSLAMARGGTVNVAAMHMESIEQGGDAKAWSTQTALLSTPGGQGGAMAATGGVMSAVGRGVDTVQNHVVRIADAIGSNADDLASTISPFAEYVPWVAGIGAALVLIGAVWTLKAKLGSIASGQPQEA